MNTEIDDKDFLQSLNLMYTKYPRECFDREIDIINLFNNGNTEDLSILFKYYSSKVEYNRYLHDLTNRTQKYVALLDTHWKRSTEFLVMHLRQRQASMVTLWRDFDVDVNDSIRRFGLCFDTVCLVEPPLWINELSSHPEAAISKMFRWAYLIDLLSVVSILLCKFFLIQCIKKGQIFSHFSYRV